MFRFSFVLRAVAACVVGCVVVAGCGGGGSGSGGASSGLPSNQFVYGDLTNGAFRLLAADADSGQTRLLPLTDPMIFATGLSLSGNRSRIAYVVPTGSSGANVPPVVVKVSSIRGGASVSFASPTPAPPGFTSNSFSPDLSPDGRRVAWISSQLSNTTGRSINTALFVANTDGTGLHLVAASSSAGFDGPNSPRWSRDGQRIFFVRFEADGNTSRSVLQSIKPDGTDEQVVFRTALGAGFDYFRLSPDNTSLVATSLNPRFELRLLRIDGTLVRTLATNGPNGGSRFYADFSPDGRRIVHTDDNNGNTTHRIVIVNTDGTGERIVVPSTTTFGDVAWR